MDRQRVGGWLERYIEAWRTYDRDRIAELFSDDVEYRYHAYDDDPVRGKSALVDGWLDDRDEPNSWEATYEPVAVDGDVAVVTGTSRYLDSDGSVDRVYHNCFVMRFDGAGRCREFTEWYMERPR
ncbi:MAG: nuclear transport factor 2 family protein [Actinomycetota bacterium]